MKRSRSRRHTGTKSFHVVDKPITRAGLVCICVLKFHIRKNSPEWNEKWIYEHSHRVNAFCTETSN